MWQRNNFCQTLERNCREKNDRALQCQVRDFSRLIAFEVMPELDKGKALDMGSLHNYKVPSITSDAHFVR